MNQPPSEDERDIDELYRRWSARDSGRPSETVRQAVLRQAVRLASQSKSARQHAAPISFRRWAGIYGGLAAATLAGFLIVPRFWPASSSKLRPQMQIAVSPPSRPPAIMPAQAHAQAHPSPPEAQELARNNVSRARSPPQGGATPAASPSSFASAARLAAGAPRDSDRVDSGAALRQAAEAGNLARLKTLLEEPLDVNARDTQGRTALMLAVLHGQRNAVDALLARGADPKLADSNGTTPLQAARDADHQAIAADLRRAGAE